MMFTSRFVRSPFSPARRQTLRIAFSMLTGAWLTEGSAVAQAAFSGDSATSPLPSYADCSRANTLAEQIARQTGLQKAWITEQISQAQFQPAVVRLILPQKPQQKNWSDYRSHFVESVHIDAGSDFIQEYTVWLNKAEERFGVSRAVIVGILGVETTYGRHMGNFRALDSLTTLSLNFPTAAPTDRSAYFARQLGDYLLWCQESSLDPTEVKGSYAGAIGMPQFMPGSILRYALNFEGGKKVDIINSPGDAIGSVANFLTQHGWQMGQPTHFPLKMTDSVAPDTLAKLLEPDIIPSFRAEELQAAGLALSPEALAYKGKLALVQLPNAGSEPDYVLGTENFYVVTRYNHSAFYALAVIELGNAAQEAALARG